MFSEYTTKLHRFCAYGMWELIEVRRADTGEAVTAVPFVMAFAAHAATETWLDLKVVEVEIYHRDKNSYEYLTGYTFDTKTPPHRKRHKDGDCEVSVCYHYAIKNLEG